MDSVRGSFTDNANGTFNVFTETERECIERKSSVIFTYFQRVFMFLIKNILKKSHKIFSKETEKLEKSETK